MAIRGIEQPAIIQIDDTLRLRKYDGAFAFALSWYQDTETVYLVDGTKEAYTMKKLEKMYSWLNHRGELYFIEIFESGRYRPIGDVTFWQEDMPVVIGEPFYRGKGIGRKVIASLIERGKNLGYDKLYVDEIYADNEGSKRCFESLGFREYEKTEKGARYVKLLA